MKTDSSLPAEVNIHIRARAHERLMLDQAAEMLGSNRSQFMMASALKEAKNFKKFWTSWIIQQRMNSMRPCNA